MNFRLPSAERLYSRSSSGATSKTCSWFGAGSTSAPRRNGLGGERFALRRARVGRTRPLQAAQVGDEGRDLLRLQGAAPRRHALGRPALRDRLEDLLDRPAVDPAVVRQVGADQPLRPLAVARRARTAEA